MKDEGERLKKVIEKVKGVRNVELEAYPEKEVRIALNPVKMTEIGVSLEDIENAIKSNNANIPGGAVKVSSKLFNVKTSGSYEDLRQISNGHNPTKLRKSQFPGKYAQLHNDFLATCHVL